MSNLIRIPPDHFKVGAKDLVSSRKVSQQYH